MHHVVYAYEAGGVVPLVYNYQHRSSLSSWYRTHPQSLQKVTLLLQILNLGAHIATTLRRMILEA